MTPTRVHDVRHRMVEAMDPVGGAGSRGTPAAGITPPPSHPRRRVRRTGRTGRPHPGLPDRVPQCGETLPREPESAATARSLTRTSLSVQELDQPADDTALIASELVSNVVQHARRESIRVTIERPEAACVRVGVVDFSRVPLRRETSPESENGRGPALVDELAEGWGTELLPWGKRVWAEIHGKEEG